MNTKHPCETVDASADVMNLAEMILSDCGQSTVISDRLQRRVAGRIQLHIDSAAQKLQGQVDALLAAMNVIALGELPDGKYANISTMAYAEEAYKAAQRAPIKDSLTTDRQAEPVALEPVEGDLLPAVGDTVLIHLSRPDGWFPHRVVGYYAWGDRSGSKSLYRVFVRVVDAEGYTNARPLDAIRRLDKKAAADGCQGQGCRLERESPPVTTIQTLLPFFAYDSEVGFERFATDAEAKQFVQEFIDEYRHEAGEGWPEEVESLCWGVVLGTTREVALPDEYSGDNGLADDMEPVDYVLADAAQQPAVPNEWRSPSDTPIVALGDALHCWLAVKSKHDSKVRVYDAYYCNFPLMQDEAGDFPDWTLHDENGEEVAMVGWAEKVAHPDFNDFYSSLGDIELIGWQPVNPPVAPTAAQKGGAA